MSLEWIIVDDTDPNISYNGDWSATQGNLDSSGSFGPPYLSTLHGIQGNGSITYRFTGTEVILTGAIDSLPPSSSEGMTWQCVVDGSPIQVNTYNSVDNRLDMCESDNLADSAHTLVVNVIASAEQTFWFDYVQYVPSPATSLTDEAMMVDSHDSRVQYSSDWTEHFPGFASNNPGAKINFSFTGTSLIWYGFYDSITFPSTQTSATYSVDGGAPTSFPLNGVTATETAQWFQVLFEINGIPAGSHTLEVVYQGNTNTAPLSVESVVFSGKDLLASIPAGGSPPTTSTPFSSPTSSTITSATSSQVSLSPSSPSSLPLSIPTLSQTTQPPATSTGLTAPGTTVPSNNNVSHDISAMSTSMTSTSTSAAAQKHGPGNTNLGIILGLSVAALLLLLGGVLVWRRRRKSYPTNNSRLEVSPFWITPQSDSYDIEQSSSDAEQLVSGPESDVSTAEEKGAIEQREQNSEGVDGVSFTTRIGSIPPPYYK